MPYYSYKHPDTGDIIDVFHSIVEISAPSPETLKMITLEDGRVMERIISGRVNIMGSFTSLPQEKKREILRKKALSADISDGSASDAMAKDRQITSEMKEIASTIKEENKIS